MIRIGILGYGNLGKSLEAEILNNNDLKLVGIFTRRNINEVSSKYNSLIYPADNLPNFKNDIDVLAICVGSAFDLPKIGPIILKDFNTVDTYDNHSKALKHFNKMNIFGKKYGKLAIVSVGWDPGLFSIFRALFAAILPNNKLEFFYGPGVSQGHSEAIRKIKGVIDARQYTIPIEETVNKVISGNYDKLTPRDKHLRKCFVVAEENANKEEIKNKIITLPGYFSDYETTVEFISLNELQEKHLKLPHGGKIISHATTADNCQHNLQLSINLESNPAFTASIMLAYIKANYLLQKKNSGALSVFDIPLKYLSEKNITYLIQNFL